MKIAIAAITCLMLFCPAANAEIEWFPQIPEYSCIYNTADPDYPCFEFFYLYSFHFKAGMNFGLLEKDFSKTSSLLMFRGFVDVEGLQRTWRGNFGINLVNRHRVLNNPQNLLISELGIYHESQHANWGINIDTSILEENENLNYLDLRGRWIHPMKSGTNMLFSLGSKYFVNTENLGLFTSFPTRKYTFGFNTDLVFEIPSEVSGRNYFIAFYGEYIAADIVNTYKYTIQEEEHTIDFNRDPITFLMVRIGLNIIKETFIVQPYMVFSLSNRRSVEFMRREFSGGLLCFRIIPR